MDNMGLEDGDDALQYALMLSMDERSSSASMDAQSQGPGSGAGMQVGEGAEADAEAELQEMLEMIRVAEERERASS